MGVVVKSADPYETDAGRLRVDEICPSGCATDDLPDLGSYSVSSSKGTTTLKG